MCKLGISVSRLSAAVYRSNVIPVTKIAIHSHCYVWALVSIFQVRHSNTEHILYRKTCFPRDSYKNIRNVFFPLRTLG